MQAGLEIHLKTHIVTAKSLERAGWALHWYKAYVLAHNLANCILCLCVVRMHW